MKFVFYHPIDNEIMIGHGYYGVSWYLLDYAGREYFYDGATPQTYGWELIGEL